MRSSERADINISSESGLEYYPGDGAYGITKHALNAMGEYIQRENQEFGIRVNTICPGMVVTEMTQHAGLIILNVLPRRYRRSGDLLPRRANIKIEHPS
jgi:NAD(P)-dependent dehydrogenase (short-subunit alcohol dehydrogenase family)